MSWNQTDKIVYLILDILENEVMTPLELHNYFSDNDCRADAFDIEFHRVRRCAKCKKVYRDNFKDCCSVVDPIEDKLLGIENLNENNRKLYAINEATLFSEKRIDDVSKTNVLAELDGLEDFTDCFDDDDEISA